MATLGKPAPRVGAGCCKGVVEESLEGRLGFAQGAEEVDAVPDAGGFGDVLGLEEGTVVSFVESSLEVAWTGAVTVVGRTGHRQFQRRTDHTVFEGYTPSFAGAGTGLAALLRNSFVTLTELNFFLAACASGGVDVRDDGVGTRTAEATAGVASFLSSLPDWLLGS